MLIQLQIENVAIIGKANIDFSAGFNVLTGETGAGKSIIIDSINAVTGEKTSKDVIRSGATKAKISAVFGEFDIETETAIAQAGCEIADDGLILISRELSADGRSVFRLNGLVVPMAVVKQIAPYLLNIHGQHDSQQLFSPSKHIIFIDSFANLQQYVSEYKNVYSEMCAVREKLHSIQTNDELKERKIELLTFQIDEILEENVKEKNMYLLLLKTGVLKFIQ